MTSRPVFVPMLTMPQFEFSDIERTSASPSPSWHTISSVNQFESQKPYLRVNNQTRREVRATCRSLTQPKTGTFLMVVFMTGVILKPRFNVGLDFGRHGDDAIGEWLIVVYTVHDDDAGGCGDDKGATKNDDLKA